MYIQDNKKDIELPLLSQPQQGKGTNSHSTPNETKPKYFDINIFSRIFFFWVTLIVNRGNDKAFQQDQHYNLRDTENTEHISQGVHKEWKNERKKSYPLIRAQYQTFKSQIWTIQALALLQTCFDFTGPIFVSKIINYVATPKEDVNPSDGIFLIVAFLLARLGIIMTSAQTTLANTTLQNKIIVGTRSLLYRKFFQFPLMRNEEYSTGSIMNHMLVDVENLGKVFLILPQLVQFPVIITIGIYMIYTAVGMAFIGGIITVVTIAFLIYKVNRLVFACQKKVMEAKDNRMKKITEILTGIKYIKMCGMEDKFLESVAENREYELKWVRKKHLIIVFRIFLFWLSPILLVISVLGFFLWFGNELTPQKAFVVLSTLMIVQMPINSIGQILNDLLQGQVSLDRLQKFLFSEEVNTEYVAHSKEPKGNIAIKIENGNFYWVKDDNQREYLKTEVRDIQLQETNRPDLILKDINMEIKKGSFVAILGDVGSGKSSLFNCLLGEMIHDIYNPPSIEINGSITYVAQKPWIVNATIKENILFNNKYDEHKYKEALRTSCLQSDLRTLIKQDETEIGEKGVNLSGGQKARVALSRAIYADSDIYLLDDPLSAVDAHVGKFILEECLTKLLKDKTRVLVTHKIESLKYVDYIYIFKAGKIVAEGNYNDVRTTSYYKEIEEKANQEAQEDDFIEEVETFEEKLSIKKSHRSSRKLTKEKNEEEIKKRKLTSFNEGADQKELMEKLMLNEDRKIGSVGLDMWGSFLKYFFGSFTLLALVMSTVFLWVFLKTSSDFWLAHWSTVTDSEHSNLYYYGIYATLGVVATLITFVRIGTVILKGVAMSRRLHTDMLKRIIRAPINLFFDRVPIGRLINRFASDLDMIDSTLPFNFGGMMHSPVNLLAKFIVCCYAGTVWVLPLAFLFLFVGVKIQRRYLAVYREVYRLYRITTTPVISNFAESLDGLTQIRSSDCQEKFFGKFYVRQNATLKNQILLAALQGWFQFHINLSSLFIIGPTIAAAVLFAHSLDSSPGLMGLLVTYLLDLSTNTINTLQQLSNIESQMISFERCKAFTHVEIENDPITKQPVENYSYSWPQHGHIEFHNYYAKYRPNLPYVLKDVTFTIKSTEKIGVVGRTGSGKSTLLLSLLRIIESQKGQIFIDGVDISQIGLDDLRRKITIIPQDPLLYKGSLRSNIDLLGKFSDYQIWDALEKVCMKNKFLESGLDTEIKEGGENLSAGEKQLLCIARAILCKTKIILVDEATSSIDSVTEETILESIRENFKDCTMITIAHRLKTIIGSDKVLFMNEGRVAEFDSPKELLKNKNGFFYALWKEYEDAKA